MNDVERLKKWMDEQGLTYRTLADATKDTHSTVHMMLNGRRDINEAYKWRFQKAFGNDVAMSIFVTDFTPAEMTEATA